MRAKALLVLMMVLVILVGCGVGSGVVVIAATAGSQRGERDLGNLHGPAVPPMWRVVERTAAAQCPPLPSEVLGALGWLVNGSGRSPGSPPPWWRWPGGSFGVIPQTGAASPPLLLEARAATRQLCADIVRTGGLHEALVAVTGSLLDVREIEVLTTVLELDPALAAGRAQIIVFAAAAIGTPYLWGGNGPNGYDCSGLVVAAYRSAGLSLPRTAQEQHDATSPILGSALPGDLVFFGASPTAITHVGIELGDGLMIDAPHSGAVVRIEADSWSDQVSRGSIR